MMYVWMNIGQLAESQRQIQTLRSERMDADRGHRNEIEETNRRVSSLQSELQSKIDEIRGYQSKVRTYTNALYPIILCVCMYMRVEYACVYDISSCHRIIIIIC